MIVKSKESKSQPSLIDLLGGSGKTKKTSGNNDVFAQLLSSMKPEKTSKAAKENGFTTIIDPKNIDSKSMDHTKKEKRIDAPLDTTKLSSKGLEELLIGKDDEREMLPKELLNLLSNDQVHSLIHKAKDYLKNAITQKSNELKTEEKEIPKTLMGLVQLAEKIGIKVNEITLSTLDDEPQSPLRDVPQGVLLKPIIELKTALEPNRIDIAPKSFEALTQLISETKAALGETKPLKNTPQEHNGSTQPLQSLLKGLEKAEISPVSMEPIKEGPKEAHKGAILNPVEGEVLSALLKGENTQDAKNENKEELKGVQEHTKSHHPLKADSLEVKNKEAIQSMRHFAIDLKEAAENYKPPFTRVTMKLNPERLGEVDVTLVQRGNNVHVTIQSPNTNSIAFLAHNVTELKAQLAHQGITNATMNFMSGGESHNPHQQQNHQQENRFRAYASFEELELNQEELSALEIILPHYA